MINMKILLVNPPYAYAYGKMKTLIPSYPPIGLAYLASVLKNHEVSILDMSVSRMDKKKFKNYVKSGNFDVIMFTATTPTINTVGNLCKIVKECNENITTIVGGSHPSALPERTLKENEAIDIIVIGEGEKTVEELVSHLSKNKKLNKVKGICYRKDSKIVRTATRPFITELDSLPLPAHDMLDLDSYTYWCQQGKKFSAIVTSRGCPYNCTFCCRGAFGQLYRYRNTKSVIDEIKLLTELGVDEIHIIDDNFTMIEKRSIKILDEIRSNFPKLHIAFINGVRIDRTNKNLLIKMKKTNVYYIGYGIESGNQRILDSIKKGITLSQAEKIVGLSKKIGIDFVACFFILGFPDETIKSIEDTIKFAKKIKPHFAKFSTLVPYPGTEVYEKLKREGRIETENWDKYGTYDKPVFKHPNLSHLEFMYLQKKAYTEFYLSNILSLISFGFRWTKNPKLLRRMILGTIPNFFSFVL
jgi:anaerobic magnesium-protoporphyrin IX monomethyl ester cyclase